MCACVYVSVRWCAPHLWRNASNAERPPPLGVCAAMWCDAKPPRTAKHTCVNYKYDIVLRPPPVYVWYVDTGYDDAPVRVPSPVHHLERQFGHRCLESRKHIGNSSCTTNMCEHPKDSLSAWVNPLLVRCELLWWSDMVFISWGLKCKPKRRNRGKLFARLPDVSKFIIKVSIVLFIYWFNLDNILCTIWQVVS